MAVSGAAAGTAEGRVVVVRTVAYRGSAEMMLIRAVAADSALARAVAARGTAVAMARVAVVSAAAAMRGRREVLAGEARVSVGAMVPGARVQAVVAVVQAGA